MMNKFNSLAALCVLIPSTMHFAMSADAEKPIVAPKMIVEPSATKVSIAKADLIVSPLEHLEQAYLGSYQLKVTPFSFKNERGTLFLKASDETMRKMSQGQAVEFTGKATNAENGKTKVVTGRTIPQANDRGAVTFFVQTENGQMVFNTSYHLVRRQ